MTETYVDPHHRLPDEDWADVVRRAEEIAREAAESAQGGAAPVAAPVLNLRGISGKHSGYSMATQLLVLHSAECPLMPGYAQSLTEWAINSAVEASWHRFIGPDRRVYMIPDNLRAWHASEANPMSIGWEQTGYARYTRAEWLSPNGLLQIDSLAYDMAMVALERGIPPVWLTTAQVTAVTTYGDRTTKGFCLHRQIDPESRTDPGNGYPYDLLMDRIRGFMGGTIEPIEPEKEEWEMATVNDIVEAVWSRHVTRVVDGVEVRIPAIQELADAKTLAEQALANTAPIERDGELISLRQETADSKTMLIAQGALLRELAANQGLDPERVEAILRDAAAEALASVSIVSRLESTEAVAE